MNADIFVWGVDIRAGVRYDGYVDGGWNPRRNGDEMMFMFGCVTDALMWARGQGMLNVAWSFVTREMDCLFLHTFIGDTLVDVRGTGPNTR